MSMDIKNVMILGGRGNLGPYLIRAFLKAGFNVSVLSRASSNVGDDNFLGAAVIKSDYSFDSLVKVFAGQDAVVSTLATANIDEQKIVVDAVAAAKVKRFVPSEFGSDTSVDDLDTVAPFLKEKQNFMNYVKSKESEGLSWTAMITGSFIDWMLLEANGLLCLDLKTKTGELVDSGDAIFTTTTAHQVGEAAAAALLHSEKTKNEYVYVSSFNTTQKELIEAIERLSGDKFKLGAVSQKDLYQRAMKHVDEGNWARGYYELATATMYANLPVSYFPDQAARWMKELGLVQDETFDEVIARVLKVVT
ncbi:NAD(P)-binding protein [Sarocladium strictum]